jgi:hypothetical protein
MLFATLALQLLHNYIREHDVHISIIMTLCRGDLLTRFPPLSLSLSLSTSVSVRSHIAQKYYVQISIMCSQQAEKKELAVLSH